MLTEKLKSDLDDLANKNNLNTLKAIEFYGLLFYESTNNLAPIANYTSSEESGKKNILHLLARLPPSVQIINFKERLTAFLSMLLMHRLNLAFTKSKNDFFPLHYAAMTNNVLFIDCYLKAISTTDNIINHINLVGRGNATALHFAAIMGCKDALVALVQWGAKRNLFDQDNKTPARLVHQSSLPITLKDKLISMLSTNDEPEVTNIAPQKQQINSQEIESIRLAGQIFTQQAKLIQVEQKLMSRLAQLEQVDKQYQEAQNQLVSMGQYLKEMQAMLSSHTPMMHQSQASSSASFQKQALPVTGSFFNQPPPALQASSQQQALSIIMLQRNSLPVDRRQPFFVPRNNTSMFSQPYDFQQPNTGSAVPVVAGTADSDIPHAFSAIKKISDSNNSSVSRAATSSALNSNSSATLYDLNKRALPEDGFDMEGEVNNKRAKVNSRLLNRQ